MDENSQTDEPSGDPPKIEFKKPVLIGRVGKLPKKAKSEAEKKIEEKSDDKPSPEGSKIEPKSEPVIVKSNRAPAVLLAELSVPIPYKEPKWSGLCPEGSDYALEVLKSGMIVERLELNTKAFYVFGRLANCDVVMAHPTVSRHHAVLQYKAFAAEGEPASGWYLYDLNSTHGTFLNKDRLKPNHYTRVKVGHQIKFGSSSRTYIVLGPDFDCEGESDLTVTEIKQKALEMKLDRDKMVQEAIEQREKEKLEEQKRKEEQGIDWGMGEDADEETDLADNPYASTANEELYLEDPKKTLRGYFEREGHELKYDCEERGVGQFLCRVELPMDDARGRPVVAEVVHRGKKKEAVVAGALEACRLLDRAGLLRQAKHESRARRTRDWAADDYYDSDDDTFLDRTGHVEKKRDKRMKKHGAVVEERNDKPLTYDDLLKEISDIESRIAQQEKELEKLRGASTHSSNNDEDDLDAYMKTLSNQGKKDKAGISITKMSIQKLKAELAKTQRLADIARPAHVPPLIKKDSKIVKLGSNSVVYGKRIRLKEDAERHKKVKKVVKQEETEFVEEMDSDEEEQTNTQTNNKQENPTKNVQETEKKPAENDSKDGNTDSKKEKEVKNPRVFGPMRPPENYVIPESYFDQETDRDLPNIEENDSL